MVMDERKECSALSIAQGNGFSATRHRYFQIRKRKKLDSQTEEIRRVPERRRKTVKKIPVRWRTGTNRSFALVGSDIGSANPW
jgi:hypothetical protein